MINKAHRKLGWRGLSLILYGVIFVISGIKQLLVQPTAPIHIVTTHFWAAGYMFSGAIAVISAFYPTPRSDKVGFVTLTILGSAWVCYAMITTVTGFTHGLLPGAITMGLAVIKILIDSGWSEPTEPTGGVVDDPQ